MLLGHNSLNLLHFAGVFGVEANMLDNGSATRFHYLPLPVNFAKAYTLSGLKRGRFHSTIHVYMVYRILHQAPFQIGSSNIKLGDHDTSKFHKPCISITYCVAGCT